MIPKKNILVLLGSASQHSANQKLMVYFETLMPAHFDCTVLNNLKQLPHFDPERTTEAVPNEISALRNQIEKADGIVICTPEYIFSIPSGLKNVLEWCVATTVFSNKPMAIITASASGEKGHEELELIMKTLMAHFTEDTTLLISGIKGKINDQGALTNEKVKSDLLLVAESFTTLVNTTNS